jgi:hypothetical protein
VLKIHNPDELVTSDWIHKYQTHGVLASDELVTLSQIQGALASNESESSASEDLRIKLDTLTARILYLETKIGELERER